jgi:nicotinamidase/pyrazinamidase
MRSYETVLVDVDTQFDFLDPAGNLYAPGAVQIHPALERLFEFARRTRVPVLSTADAHSAHDPEFERFGRHCEVGTLGQHKLPFTVLPASRVIRHDETLPAGADALLRQYQQLIFQKADINVFVNPHLGALVDTLRVGEYIVFGVATDYCVATAVEGLLERGARTALVTDAIRAIDEEQGEAIIRRFADRGVRLTRTAEVVHLVDEETDHI